MSDETTNDARLLWQRQPAGGGGPALEDVRRSAGAFHRTIRRRNRREYLAAVAVAVFFGWHAATAGELHAIFGSTLLALAAVYVAAVLHRRGSPSATPLDVGLLPCLEFHRAQLVRQRDLLRSVWRWYLLPFVPGLVVLLGGQVQAHPESARRVVPFAILCALLFFAIGWLNRHVARSLQRDIDDLEASR
jgi:hypothetical protein